MTAAGTPSSPQKKPISSFPTASSFIHSLFFMQAHSTCSNSPNLHPPPIPQGRDFQLEGDAGGANRRYNLVAPQDTSLSFAQPSFSGDVAIEDMCDGRHFLAYFVDERGVGKREMFFFLEPSFGRQVSTTTAMISAFYTQQQLPPHEARAPPLTHFNPLS